MDYNVIIDLLGLLIVGIVIVSDYRQKLKGDFLTHMLRVLLMCVSFVFLIDIPGLIMNGMTFNGVRPLLFIFDTLYWLGHIVYCYLWRLFADYWNYHSMERIKRVKYLYAIPMILEIIIIFLNLKTGWIFVIDERNLYQCGSAYQLNMIFYYIYIIDAFAITLYGGYRAEENAQRRRSTAMIMYMFLPLCGVLLEIFLYGITWVWPFVALSLLMVYLSVQDQQLADERLTAAKYEAELAQAKIDIMLSQIQPHFLFNALSAIVDLCEDNTKAKNALMEFARYLRVNVDSIKQSTPQPFETELSHIKTYLSLEKLRFGDKLNVVYDIQSTDFNVPSLSIQPIVENAVKHGILNKDSAGTVELATKEDANFYIITITDNGVGFDMNAEKCDDKTHVGLDNVRYRLSAMCSATLILESASGVGTRATIKLPKRGLIS